jgi:hypothetical protein
VELEADDTQGQASRRRAHVGGARGRRLGAELGGSALKGGAGQRDMGEITLGAAGNSASIAFPSPHGLPLFRDGGAVSAGLSQIAASLLQMRKGSIAHMSDAKKGAGTRETARAWLGTRDECIVS